MNKIKLVFSLYVLSFVLLFAEIFFNFTKVRLLFHIAYIAVALGIVLFYLTLKEKGKLRIYLILSSCSIIVFFIGMLLHNFFYAFTILSENIIILKYLFEALHVIFFIISTIIAPLLFIIGIIGSIFYFIKKK